MNSWKGNGVGIYSGLGILTTDRDFINQWTFETLETLKGYNIIVRLFFFFFVHITVDIHMKSILL